MTPSPTPIPVQGDVQIFADVDCKQYPTVGEEYTSLYARVNVPWGFDGAWQIDNVFTASGPVAGYEDDPYYAQYLNTFVSADSAEPFEVGQVILLEYEEPVVIPEGSQFVITKP